MLRLRRLLLATALLAGCQERNASEKLPEGPPPAPETLPSGKVLDAPPDSSLTPAEYGKLGVPAEDRIWTGDDMERAAKALTEIARAHPTHLPRYRSERSGTVFARITAPRNLEPYRDASEPSSARLSPALNYFNSTNDLLQLYVVGFLNGATGDSELVELLGSEFRTTVVLIGLVDEIIPTLKPEDPDYARRMAGLDKMRSGLGSVVAGGLTTLTEGESYRTSERRRLLEYMKETFPVIAARLSPGAQSETLGRLGQLRKNPELASLQPGLDELHAAIARQVGNAGTP